MKRTETSRSLFKPFPVLVIDSPLGKIRVESDGELITRTSFENIQGGHGKMPSVLVEAEKQFKAYFNQKKKTFDLPLQEHGTRFQRMVRHAIETVPYGNTTTYGSIGDGIGGKAIARTVGQACATNPFPILVPCHRVIASDGLLTGYVGGLWRKKWLLVHEGALPKELFT